MIRTHFLLASALVCALGCDTPNATTVVVDNDYPAFDAGDPKEITVFKLWWAVSLLPDPVAPGGEGQPQRTVLNTDFAYALLAPGWDPSSSTPPARLFPAKSSAKLTVARGDVLHVHVSDATFVGDCAAGKPLAQGDADFITQSIFPGEFAGVTYVAATCASEIVSDGGADGAVDGGPLDASDGDGGVGTHDAASD